VESFWVWIWVERASLTSSACVGCDRDGRAYNLHGLSLELGDFGVQAEVDVHVDVHVHVCHGGCRVWCVVDVDSNFVAWRL
jgi:hypothetical protein